MLRQFAVDGKGCVFIGVFGVPQHAHEDDEARAVGAALRVLASLATLGVDARAGIAAGRAYCGLVGTAARSGTRCSAAPSTSRRASCPTRRRTCF